jgi:NADPH-dependent 2,4-dienoyl-CoA reductase/sulfur reductase-like enzyme
MPFPGWTLPGVMTAGAGQILLKSTGIVPATPVVLAGSGPLLLLLAAQYLRAGVDIAALVETTRASNRFSALRHLGGALRGSGYLRKGHSLLREIRAGGVRHYSESSGLRAEGDGCVEAAAFHAAGRSVEIPCRTLLVHNGVVPNVQFSRALGLRHVFDARQRCWRPALDSSGQSEIPGIAIAGDGAGIGGAQAAVHAGRLCALHAARRLGVLGDAACERQAAMERRALARHLAVRPFLDALYAPSPEFLVPEDDTLVCRCEEITAGDIRGFVALGCRDVNEVKSYGRPGMGPCQGRYCGLIVAEVLADSLAVDMDAVGYYRIRPPVKPVSLGELVALERPQEAHTGA